MTIKVLLADDHTLVRAGIRALLDAESDIDVVGEADNGREAMEQAERLRPDLIVMDHTMPALNGLEATRQLHQRAPEIQVLILTMHTNEEYVFQFLQAGAAGYLIKESAPNELVAAIRSIYRGESFLSPTVSRAVIDEYVRRVREAAPVDSYAQLTSREREVLQLVAEGFTNREVGEQLMISVKTAAVHRTNILQKLNLHSMAELTKYAIRKGIISLEQ